MRYRIIYPEKLLRPANIPPRFTLPARLYPFPGCVATYPAFKAFEILSSETARSWKEIRLELFIHTIQKAKWKRKRGEETEAERKTGGIDGETGRGGKDKRGKMRKVENRDRERAGWERETAEKCELNELWDADCKPATFIHSLHHIHDKELWRLFFLSLPLQLPAVCLQPGYLWTCLIAQCLLFHPDKNQHWPQHFMAMRFIKHQEPMLILLWHMSASSLPLALQQHCVVSSDQGNASYVKFVECRLGSYCTHAMEKHSQLRANIERTSAKW